MASYVDVFTAKFWHHRNEAVIDAFCVVACMIVLVAGGALAPIWLVALIYFEYTMLRHVRQGLVAKRVLDAIENLGTVTTRIPHGHIRTEIQELLKLMEA